MLERVFQNYTWQWYIWGAVALYIWIEWTNFKKLTHVDHRENKKCSILIPGYLSLKIGPRFMSSKCCQCSLFQFLWAKIRSIWPNWLQRAVLAHFWKKGFLNQTVTRFRCIGFFVRADFLCPKCDKFCLLTYRADCGPLLPKSVCNFHTHCEIY